MRQRFICRSRGRGFTLIELVVVVAIISVLAGVIIPMTGSVLAKSKIAAATANLTGLRTAMTRYFELHSIYPSCDSGNPCSPRFYNCHRSWDANWVFNHGNCLKPYLDKPAGNDPWGTPWYYHLHLNSEYTFLGSYGPDRSQQGYGPGHSGPGACCPHDDIVIFLGRYDLGF